MAFANWPSQNLRNLAILDKEENMSVLVGKRAPDFVATAVKEDRIIEGFKLSDLKGKYIVLFFYPLDFYFCMSD